jgi:prepilin-type N-terminal cleavage/methylation domain-containing protein
MRFSSLLVLRKHNAGYTLPEVIVAVFIFAMISLGIYEGYATALNAVTFSRLKTEGTLIANEQVEFVRSLPYDDVGIVSGLPSGVIPFSREFFRGNATFTVESTVRNVDDPFDGVIGGTPNDLSPADYKLVEFVVSCSACQNFPPLTFTTTAAPKNLENTAGNGALFVRVFDANGIPIQGANVLIENNSLSTPITINEVTDVNGLLQLVDAPPGFETYEITASKSGFSEDRTYLAGDVGNPNPIKRHATVASGTVTQVSFAIDELSNLSFQTKTNICTSVSNINFDMQSSKLIGTSPDVYKYSQSHVTNGSGVLSLSNIEWDTYTTTLTDAEFFLSGSIPFLPLSVNPAEDKEVLFVVKTKNPKGFLVSVKDGGTGLPLSDASVSLTSTSTSFSEELITSKGYFIQTDWSGGDGQADFIDETRFFTSDGNVDVGNFPGDIKLENLFGDYDPSGWIESSTFDSGASTTVYHNIAWRPTSAPPETGADSIKFQVAANNDNSTWNFIGPDGSGGSFYTLTDNTLHVSHNNNRYLRYRAYLSTASTSFTPTLSDISITFGSQCVPFGQVFFDGLSAGSYTLTVSKVGYQEVVQDITISPDWQSLEINLIPE